MGLRIDVDTSRGISSLSDFRKSLKDTGAESRLTEREIQALEERFERKLAADNAAAAMEKARRKIEETGKAAGLSEREIRGLCERAGVLQNTSLGFSSALSGAVSIMESMASKAATLTVVVSGLATALGAAKIETLIRDSATSAARFDTLGVVIKAVGENVGYTQNQMLGYAKSVETAGISMTESRQTVVQMASAHLDLADAVKLARVAQDAAVVANINSSDALGQMVRGIVSGETESLRAMGINVDFQNSYQRLANEIDKTVDSLSERQKVQARTNEVIKEGAAREGLYVAAMTSAGKQMTSFSRYVDDFKVKTGEAFQPAMIDTIGHASIVMKAFQDEISRPDAQRALEGLGNAISKIATNSMSSLPGALNGATAALQRMVDAWNSLPTALQAALIGGAAGAGIGAPLGGVAGIFGGPGGALGGLVAGAGGGAAIGALAGFGAYGAGVFDTIGEKISKTTEEVKRLESQLALIKTPLIGTQKLTESLQKSKQELEALRKIDEQINIFEAERIKNNPTGWEQRTAIAANEWKAAYGKGVDAYRSDSDTITKIIQMTADSLPVAVRWADAVKEYTSNLDTIKQNLADAVRAGDHSEIDRATRALLGNKAAFEANAERLRLENIAPLRTLEAAKSSVLSDQALLNGDKYESERIRAAQAYQAELDTINDRLATYTGTERKALEGQKLWAKKREELALARAELDKWNDSMNAASAMLGEMGRLSGNPTAIYGSLMTTAQSWESDQAKRIGAIQDESERTKQLGELQQVMALKELEARRQAYSGMSAVSSKYWEAEKQTIEQHLAVVKANAADETAYKIYAAEQWDDYNKKILEKQAAYSETFTDAFAAKWSLAFGSYKSGITRARDDYVEFSDSLITLTDGVITGVSGSFGDLIRNFQDIASAIQNMWKNMFARMLDAAGAFVEESMKSQLKDLASSFFKDTPGSSSSAGSSGSTSSGSFSDLLSGLMKMGPQIGTSAGDALFKSAAAAAGSSDGSLIVSTQDMGEAMGGAVANKMSSAIWARNNNPGNIRSGSGFATYDSMQDGLSAMADLLKSYERRGFDTVTKIVSRYAPSSENNTAAYIASVSKEMGVGANDKLRLASDSGVLTKLLKAMTRIEGSRGALTDDMFYNATHAKQIGQAMGDSAGDRLVENFTASSSDSAAIIGNDNALAKIFSDGIDMSKLGPSVWQSASSEVPYSAMAGTYSNAELEALAGTKINWKAAGTVLGGLSMLGAGVASGNAMSAIGGGLTSLGGILGMAGMATGGPILAAVGMGVGLLGGLFDQQKKEIKKAASGYNIQYASGKTVTSGVDFYSDGSVVGTGASDPDVTKKISTAFKDAAENLQDFADTLGFTVNVLDGFKMPSMNITDSQLDTYIRNGTNTEAFQALEQAGLRGAFDELAQDGEIYVDEVDRLSSAYSAGASQLSAYGYSMADAAQVTDAQIEALRQQTVETAAGTSQAIITMASAMGATSDQLALLSANASDGSQALSVTNEQLSNLLEANWVSDVEDQVGGADAFNSIMGNLTKNIFDSIDAYAKNLGYYNQMAGKYITQLGDDGITVDNFWQKFDTALKQGMSPEQFELWGKASTWVNSIDSVNDALAQWNEGMNEMGSSLDSRMQKAQGLTYEASITDRLASAEKELYEARKAGYGDAYIARLQEVQAAELQSLILQHQEDYAKEMRDVAKRYATAIGDNSTLIQIQMEENAKELQDLAKTYNWSPGSAEEPLFQALQRAQTAELVKTITDTAKSLADATLSMQQDLAARKATIAGYEEEAEALQKVASYQQELNQAYSDGLDSSIIDDLMKTQLDELAKYWKDTLEDMRKNLRDLYQQQADLLSSLTGNTQDTVTEIYNLFTRYKAGETDLADDIVNALKTVSTAVKSMVDDIYNTIAKIRTGEDYSTSTADVNASTALAYFDEIYTKAASGDTDAMSSVTSYATSYLDALKKSTADQSVYQSGVDYVTSMLSRLAGGASSSTGGLTDIAKSVTDDQIAEAEKKLKQAEVAQLKTTYDTLWAQTVEAFKGSDAAKYIQGLATTGAGWQGMTDLFVDYEGDGLSRLQEMQSGRINYVDYIGWFQNNYGTGTGYVDWAGAMALWKQYATLPSSVSSLYQQSQTAYTNWQTLKSQYGFSTGGVISSDSSNGDNTLLFANGKERVLTERQNRAFERLAYGSQSDSGQTSALLIEIRLLREEVKSLRASNTEENRAIVKHQMNGNDMIEDAMLNGMPVKSA